jgi:Lrp/AsnC family transcriptional regulator, leucine-responsive regulatory protein
MEHDSRGDEQNAGDLDRLLRAHVPAIDQLDRLLDAFLMYGSTTTSIIQSSPVPLRPPPLPEDPSSEEDR